MKCFECEATEDLQEHHVVPRFRGGTKTITLCYSCHLKAHGQKGDGLNHSKLVSDGIKRKFEQDPEARSNWGAGARPEEAVKRLVKGRIKKADEFAMKYGEMIVSLKEKGHSLRSIASILTEKEIKTPNGKDYWSHVQARAVILRYKKLKQENGE